MEVKYLYRDVTGTLAQSSEAYRVREGPGPGGPDWPHASETGRPPERKDWPRCRWVGGKPAEFTVLPAGRKGCSYHSGGCSLRSDPKEPAAPEQAETRLGLQGPAGSSSFHSLTAVPDFSSFSL